MDISSIVTNTIVGEPMGRFYGYKVAGIFQNQSEIDNSPSQSSLGGTTAPGDIKYVDVNKDGKIDQNDRTFIGSPHPDVTFGFNNSLRYKNFELSMFIQGSLGNDILNLTRRLGVANNALYTNQLAEAANFWTPTNTNTNIPAPKAGDDNPNILISNRYIENGSYVRIQNVTLAYVFDKELTSKYKISKLRLYTSIQNLYTFTNYKGYDPEIGTSNQDALLAGIDSGRYPSSRVYTVGVNVEF